MEETKIEVEISVKSKGTSQMKKKVLIFIHKSLGELDWIAPFIRSKEAEEFDFYVYLNKMGGNYEKKKEILVKYGLNISNVTLLDNKEHSRLIYKLIDRRLRKVKKKVNWFDSLAAYLRLKSAKSLCYEEGFDFIFREYKVRYTFELACFLRVNKQAKVVVFPHAIAIPKKGTGFIATGGKPPAVKINLWLENSNLAYQLPDIRHVFYASGAPGLSSHYEKEGLFDPFSKNVLINTRNEFELHGCTKDSALNRFDDVLSFCQNNGLTVYVKHHPRDHELYLYRDIQEKYDCVKEYVGTLTNMLMKFRACLSFFSTSGMYLTARQIPVIDITPYFNFDDLKPLALHYRDKEGRLTNDLMEIGVQERLSKLDFILSEEWLSNLSEKQFKALKLNFPEDSNNKIVNKLKELIS